jgi:hypothetical protein
MKLFWGMFDALFGCRHRHLSRVFTIKHRTYKVCFDCGREFDLPSAHEPKRPGRSQSARMGENAHAA